MHVIRQRLREHAIVRVAGVALLMLGLAACGAPPEDAPMEGPAPSEAPASPVAVAVTRDLATFDVCAIVTAADVAVVLDATPGQTTGEATMGSMAADCTYTVERGGTAKDYAMVWVYSPDFWDPSTASGGESISGLGDEAFMDKPFSFDQVNVLVKGNFFLQARANSPEQARKLADLAVARMTAATR